MTDEAKSSIILFRDLKPDEQEKVERLGGVIAKRFIDAGRVVRLCRGRPDGDPRVLDFCEDLLGDVAVVSVPAKEFGVTTDAEAVAMIQLS